MSVEGDNRKRHERMLAAARRVREKIAREREERAFARKVFNDDWDRAQEQVDIEDFSAYEMSNYEKMAKPAVKPNKKRLKKGTAGKSALKKSLKARTKTRTMSGIRQATDVAGIPRRRIRIKR